MVPAVCGGVLQVSGLGKLGSALLGEEPLGDAQWNPTPSTSLSAGSSAKGGLGWGTHEFSVVNQAVTLTTGSMSEMGISTTTCSKTSPNNAHYRLPPKSALMSLRLKNSNPRTPIVTEMRTNPAVTNVATPKLWTVTIPLLGVVKARTFKRTTDETAQIQRRLWKTSIEKRDQGCNRNSPTPVASPHNDMQTSRTARSFS